MAGRPGRRRHFRARIPWFQRLAAPFSAGPLGPDAGGRVPSGRPPSGKPSALSRRTGRRPKAEPPSSKGGFPSQAERNPRLADRNPRLAEQNPNFSERNPNPCPSTNRDFTTGYPRFRQKSPSPLLCPSKDRLRTLHGPPVEPTAPAAVRGWPISIAFMGTMITRTSIFPKQMLEQICRSGHAGRALALPPRGATADSRPRADPVAGLGDDPGSRCGAG